MSHGEGSNVGLAMPCASLLIFPSLVLSGLDLLQVYQGRLVASPSVVNLIVYFLIQVNRYCACDLELFTEDSLRFTT